MTGRQTEARRYVDQLERQLQTLRSLPGWQPHWGGLALGAVIGALAQAASQLRLPGPPAFDWTAPLLPALGGALLLGYGGAQWGNYLLRSAYPPLLALARANLLEQGLLLLSMQSELPVRYEKLRHAAQSYGKTRERSWAELRPGSMRDRLHWLLMNYRLICQLLELPSTLPWLQRVKTWLGAGMLLPVVVMCLTILIGAVLGAIGSQWWIRLLLLSIAAQLTLSFGFVFFIAAAQRIERLAVASVLVSELDQDAIAADVLPAGG